MVYEFVDGAGPRTRGVVVGKVWLNLSAEVPEQVPGILINGLLASLLEERDPRLEIRHAVLEHDSPGHNSVF